MKKYPEFLFVQYQGEGDGEYFETQYDIAEIPNDGKVAIYELKEIKKRETKIKLI